jgi:hypothetical protein
MSEISPHVYCISFTMFFVIILLFIIQSYEKFIEMRRSELLNMEIGIQETHTEADKAFQLLESNFNKVYNFINQLDSKYPDDEDVQRLVRRMDNVKIEESKNEEGTSSYTVNKGDLMSICVRYKPDHTQFHDNNTLWFVLMHEIAHVMSVSEGHGPEFMKNFKFVLQESEKMNIYTPVDYSNNNITYCGVKVTNNPYF